MAVEVHRVLADLRVSNPSSVKRQRRRVRHVRVQHTARVRPGAVRAAVDHERRRVPLAGSLDDVAVEVDGEDVGRAQLRPVRAVAVEQEQVVTAGDGEAEVVVDALVEAVQRGRPEAGREIDLRLLDDVDPGRRCDLRHLVECTGDIRNSHADRRLRPGRAAAGERDPARRAGRRRRDRRRRAARPHRPGRDPRRRPDPRIPLGDGLRDADVHRRHPAAAARPRPAPRDRHRRSRHRRLVRRRDPGRLADRRPQRHPPRADVRRPARHLVRRGGAADPRRTRPDRRAGAPGAGVDHPHRHRQHRRPAAGARTGRRAQGGPRRGRGRALCRRSVPGAPRLPPQPHRARSAPGIEAARLGARPADLAARAVRPLGAGGQGVDQHPGRRLRGRGGRRAGRRAQAPGPAAGRPGRGLLRAAVLRHPGRPARRPGARHLVIRPRAGGHAGRRRRLLPRGGRPRPADAVGLGPARNGAARPSGRRGHPRPGQPRAGRRPSRRRSCSPRSAAWSSRQSARPCSPGAAIRAPSRSTTRHRPRARAPSPAAPAAGRWACCGRR